MAEVIDSHNQPNTQNQSHSSSLSIIFTTTLYNFATPIKLDRHNFKVWKPQVLAAIRANELEGLSDGSRLMPSPFITRSVDGTNVVVSSNPNHALWKKQDQTLLGWLYSSMTEVMLSTVTKYSTSFEVWNALESSHQAQSRARILQLRLQL